MIRETSEGRSVGALRRRLLLEAPVEIPDGAGGQLRSFETIAAVWAQVEWLSGNERWRGERPEQAASHRVTLRWRADVDAGQRLRDGARRRLVCLVEEVSR